MYQPLAPAVAPVTASTAEGAVLSSLIVSGAASVLRPASLVQEPVKSSPVVSSVWAWSTVHTTGSLMLSVPFVLTATLLVYHPFAPSVPVAVSVAEGAVLSSFTVNGSALP